MHEEPREQGHILIISEQWWPEGTGGILATYYITNLLKEFGNITVLTGSKNINKIKGIKFFFEPLLSTRVKLLIWLNALRLARRDYFIELIKSSDVIYIPRLAYPLIPVAKRFNKKVIVHLHDHQPLSYSSVIFKNFKIHNLLDNLATSIRLELFENGNLVRALANGFFTSTNSLIRLWLRDADVIVCASKYLADIISSTFPELIGKLKVIYNPVPNIASNANKEYPPSFLYVGGDSYIKGFHILMSAIISAIRKGLRFKLFVAGNMRGITQSNKFVSFLGHIGHDEVMKLHNEVRALLFPSICEEPLPYAVLEAMLAGTVPIASRVGGVPEIVQGTYAEETLFESGNVEEAVDRIEQVLSLSKEELASIGVELRESVLRRFNNERIKQQLFEVFNL